MHSARLHHRICTAILWVAVVSAARADVPLVYATLEPKQITLGESARLTITNLGTGSEPLTLPTVTGLQFEVLGRSHQVEMINGTTLTSTSIVVQVTPQIAGVFTIPPITPKSQSLILQVNADHGPPSSTPGNSNYMIRPPILPNAPNPAGIRLTADGAAFVKLNVPKRAVYVGESIPVDIEVGMRAGFVTSLNGLPTLTGGEFTLNNLSHQPDRRETIIDEKHFTLLTWHSVLAAVKPGSFSLAVETPLTVRISTRPKGDSALDDLLGDPFLQNFFGSSVSKDITVASPPSDLTVLALPGEGRPPGFSGAVGSFKISSEVSPSAGAAGDPLTLRMRVSGTGNFDRVDSNMLDHLDQWKTYPPKSTFSPGDSIGYKGEKTFEQPIIALQAGEQTLPGLTFTYFDPISRVYETARSAPISVNIAPAAGDAAPTTAATVGAASASDGWQGGYRPDHAAAHDTAQSLLPLYLRPEFLAVPSVLTAAFIAGFIGLRRRNGGPGARSASSRETPKELKQLFARLDLAVRAGDAVAFFSAARAALQQMLACRWSLPPERVTATEISARLGPAGTDLRELFLLADEIHYAGQAAMPAGLERWMQIVRRRLGEDAS